MKLYPLLLLLATFMFASCSTTCTIVPEGDYDVEQGLQISRRLLSKELASRKALDDNPAAMYELAKPSEIMDDDTVLLRCVEQWIPACDPLQAIMLRRIYQLGDDYTLAIRGEKGRPLTGVATEGVQLRNDQAYIQSVIREREKAAAAKAPAPTEEEVEPPPAVGDAVPASTPTDPAAAGAESPGAGSPAPAPESKPASATPPAPAKLPTPKPRS